MSRLAQVFSAVVVFPEAYVENESGARVPVPPDFLKASPGAADAFNALPRTCEKASVVKRSAEEDNDNERWRSLSFVVIAVSDAAHQVQGQFAQTAAARRGGRRESRREQRCGRWRQQQRQRRAHFPRRCCLVFLLVVRIHRSHYDALPAIALAQQAAAAARARADAAGPSLKKPSAFLAESSDEGEARPPKAAPASKSAAVAGQATLFSFLQGKAK